MKKRFSILVFTVFFAVLLLGAQTVFAAGFTIALANSYAGNAWRTQMVKDFTDTAQAEVKSGLIKDFKVLDANGSVSTQISQLNDLILQHVSAIVIDAASTTALNSAIQKAIDSGIVVISYDQIVTNPNAYKINYNYFNLGKTEGEYVVKRLNGQGNVLECRGFPGTTSDKDYVDGWMSVFKNYSGIKIVGTVRGNWTATVAKSATAAVLPNLPKIDAVVDEGGGDSYGLAEAFADSNRPMPIVFGDNSGPFLIWWAQQAQKNGYETMGQASVPAVGSAAFYVAIAVLQGKKVPKSMDMPFLTFTNSTLKDWSNVQMNGMADPQYDYDWVQANLLNQ